MDKYTLIHLLIILLMDLEFQVFYYCNTYLPCTWPRMFMGCVPKSVVMAFQVVILIYTHSMELEFPISHCLGVLRLLGFCQPLKQYLKPVLMFIFISLVPRCFHMFTGCLGFLFCDSPVCCLCPPLCQVICPLLLFLL